MLNDEFGMMNGFGIWDLIFGICLRSFGIWNFLIWNLPSVFWNLGFDFWDLSSGFWNLGFDFWDLFGLCEQETLGVGVESVSKGMGVLGIIGLRLAVHRYQVHTPALSGPCSAEAPHRPSALRVLR